MRAAHRTATLFAVVCIALPILLGLMLHGPSPPTTDLALQSASTMWVVPAIYPQIITVGTISTQAVMTAATLDDANPASSISDDHPAATAMLVHRLLLSRSSLADHDPMYHYSQPLAFKLKTMHVATTDYHLLA